MIKLNGALLGSTPILTFPSNQLQPWDQAWGATYLQKDGKWAFPAYFPFADRAMQDLRTIAKD
jgi:hypothetical protein